MRTRSRLPPILTRGIIRSVWLLKAAPSAGAGAAVHVPTQCVLSLMAFDASLLRFLAGQTETLPHLDRQARESSERVVEPALRLTAEFDGLHLAREEGQHDLGFQARHRHADTAVDSDAEGEVAGRAARDVEAVRVLPTPSVSVRGGQEEQDLLALAEPRPPDLDGARRGTEERLDRRLEPEHLLERRARKRGIVPEPLPLLRMLREAEERVAQADHGGIQSR